MPVPRRVVCWWVLVLSGVIAVQYDAVLRSAQDRPEQSRRAATQGQSGGPRYQVDPWWPRPFTDQSWVLGSITGVAVDARSHIWVVHRGGDSLEANEKGMMVTPPSASLCCQAAPSVLEFDQKGVLVSSWGGPGQGYVWPQSPGSLALDAKGNVWITAAGLEPPPATPASGRGDAVVGEAPAPAAGRGRGGQPPSPPPGPPDAHVLKFSRDGKLLLQIGEPGKMDGPDSHTTLSRPSAVAVDIAANEVFIADAGNRRIVVFDADRGTYKRHWFAYGEKRAGAAPSAYAPGDAPAKSFRDVTCIDIARDGQVYVCDRSSNRIQVFRKDGTFVKEGLVSKNTLGATVTGQFGVVSSHGSAWDLAFSSDASQRYLFVANGHDKKVHILQRDTLAPVGTFGSGGRYPGQFLALGSIAVDAQGNVYAGEQHHGKRVQKFVVK
jgi:DNA-binding beta-propeller fold protein YncE